MKFAFGFQLNQLKQPGILSQVPQCTPGAVPRSRTASNVYVVICVFFFLPSMRVTKKSSSRVIFFCGKSCKPVIRIYRKKKIHDVTIFLLHAFTAKKNLHALPQKNITRCDDFFLHAFTAKIKKIAQPYRKETITDFNENACL